MHSFSFSPPPVREAAPSERLQKNARMFLFSGKSVSSQLSITVFVETALPLRSLMSVVNHASFSVEVGASGAKGATLDDWGEHMRVLCGTFIDFTAFLCLSLLFRAFQAAFRSTANAYGDGATPESVHEALHQSI